ncbi:MAG: galactokinase [Bacteroidetes bacterium]|nr:MAG: galactokinase [Bacteroidota bacterium]
MKISIGDLQKQFIDLNGPSSEEINVYFAPGRVNLIGEHTDYNDGLVFPFALQYGTYLLARKASDSLVKFKSVNFPMTAQVCLQNEVKRVGDTWINYPLGVIHEFEQKGHKIGGLELLFDGDIPNEAGLSSSASIEMVTAFAINEMFGFGLEMIDLIKLSQNAENNFVGMNCGIMDQFAVGMGKKNHGVLLDCSTLEYELVPFNVSEYSFVVSNTNKKRGLADSKYNERRAECEQAVKDISQEKSISSLSQLKEEEFWQLSGNIDDPEIIRRAKHVVTENERVRLASKFFKEGNLMEVGKLMHKSHNSLRGDYEVSCFELDVMVEEAMKVEDVLGSRMTGAGFGGCTISIVHNTKVETFIREVGKNYLDKTSLKADFYLAEAGGGTRKISN